MTSDIDLKPSAKFAGRIPKRRTSDSVVVGVGATAIFRSGRTGARQRRRHIVEITLRRRIHTGQAQLKGIVYRARDDELATRILGLKFVSHTTDDFELVRRIGRPQRNDTTWATLSVK